MLIKRKRINSLFKIVLPSETYKQWAITISKGLHTETLSYGWKWEDRRRWPGKLVKYTLKDPN